MSRILRPIGWILLVGLGLLVALLLILRFRPDAAIWAANAALDDTHITTDGLELRFFPPSLQLAQGTVELTDQTIGLSNVDARFDAGAWRKDSPFWAVTASSVVVDVTGDAAPESDAPVNLALPNLAPFLSFTRLGVDKLEMTGNSPLTASLNADRNNDDTVITAHIDQAGQKYSLNGTVVSTSGEPLSFEFDIAGESGGKESLAGKLIGTLAHDNGTKLSVTQGNATLGDEEAQRIENISGLITIPASGDQLKFDDLKASVTSPAAGIADFPVSISGSATFGNEALRLLTEGQVDQNEIDLLLEVANSTGRLSGKIDVTSNGAPAGIALAPYSDADLFPAELSTRFSLEGATVTLDELKLETPKNALTGNLRATTEPPWVLVADLHAPRLFYPLVSDAPDVEGAPQGETPDNAPTVALQETEGSEPASLDVSNSENSDSPDPDSPSPDSERLFTQAPIDWSWLGTAEINAKLAADVLALEDAQFTNLKIELQNNDGQLALKPLSASLGEGGFEGELVLALQEGTAPDSAGAEQPVALSALFEMSGVALESFGLVPTEELSGGQVEANIKLASEGNSSAQLAAGLNGDILVMVEDALLMNDFIELAGSDLVMETLNKLNPFAKKDPTTELSCALVHFTAEDGKLVTKNQLVMETSKMEIIGDGNIDLNDEKISLGITPNAKSGVGVNIGSAVKFMKLGGTLSSPRPAVSAGGLLKSGLAIGAAISTGGASVVAEGLAKRALNAGSACEAARKQAAAE